MEGEIRRYFRDFTWTVRPPRDLQERAVRVDREREALTSDLGRAPTARELADRIGCSVEDIIDATEAARARGSDSFDRTLGADEDASDTLGDRLGGDDPGFAAAEATATLDRLLDTLSERDALVLRLRFHEELTQAEIGARICRSQMHVSRILRAALARVVDHAERRVAPPRRAQRQLTLD